MASSSVSIKSERQGFRYNLGILLRLVSFVLPHKRLVILNALALSAMISFMFIMPWILGQAVDSVEAVKILGDAETPERDMASLPIINRLADPGTLLYLLLAALAVLLAGIFRGVAAFAQTFLNQTVSQKVAYDVRNKMYRAYQDQSFSFYDKISTAELMSRATADVEAARMLTSMGLPRPFQTTIFFTAILVFLWFTSPALAMISFVAVPFIGYRAVRTSARLRPVWLSIQEGQAAMTTVLQENLSGAKIVRSFGRQAAEADKFHGRTDYVYDRSLVGTSIRASNNALMTFTVWALMGVTLLYGGREIINGNMTEGQLLQAFIYLVMLTEQVRMLGFLGDLVSRSVAAGERIFEVLDARPDITDAAGAKPLENATGRVVFNDVSFAYNSLASMLRNISLEANPDQVVAVIGATGSGKSTLVSLIPRFYDVTEGSVTIDGMDVRDMTLDSLRGAIGTVQQDVFLFSATIRDNIAYGRSDATMEEIVQVAKAARLHDFIETLPDGYDTWVGERGITLSGGQKQRLAIARTLVLDPRILVLDDSLSSVDTETEYLIQQALAELMKGRTTFIIAHRLANLKRAHQILVLQEGEIIQRGTHTDLVAQAGLYQDIYEMQLRSQEEALEATQHVSNGVNGVNGKSEASEMTATGKEMEL